MSTGSSTSPTLTAAAGDAWPQECLARIAEVRRRWVTLRRVLAFSLLLAGFAAIGAAAIGFDAILRGGHVSRFILLILFAACVVQLFRRRVRPLWPEMSPNEAALRLEECHPELAGLLVTAVQLADGEARRRGGASHILYEQVRSAAERSATALQPERVVPSRQPLRHCAAAWAIVLVVTVVIAWKPALASIGISRLLTPWSEAEWPRRTRIELSDLKTGQPLRVVRGGTLNLHGKVFGSIPSTGTLHLQSDAAPADRTHFEIGEDATFAVKYRPVNRSLRVWFQIGDARSPDVQVEMVPPPEIASVEAECRYPEFTRQDKERRPDGNIQAVLGTQVVLHVTANKPLAGAVLAWENAAAVPMSQPAGDSTQQAFQAGFRVEATRSYRIHLTDQMGFHNEEPVVYRVEMVDNQYPQIERTTPATDKRVGPRAILPITVDATDDFGVTELTLCYRKGKKDDPVQRLPITLPPVDKRMTAQYPWSLESLHVTPGTTLNYWIEARDAGEHAVASDWPISRSHNLTVMEEAEIIRLLTEQIDQVLEKLGHLKTLQDDCSDAVKRISSLAGSTTQAADSRTVAADRTRAEKNRQDQIARTAAQIAERLGAIADDFVISRIGDPARIDRLKQTAAQMGRLAGTDMPGIVLALDEALAELAGTPRPATSTAEAP